MSSSLAPQRYASVPSVAIPNHARSEAESPVPTAAFKAVKIVITGTWFTTLNVPEEATTDSLTSTSQAVARSV